MLKKFLMWTLGRFKGVFKCIKISNGEQGKHVPFHFSISTFSLEVLANAERQEKETKVYSWEGRNKLPLFADDMICRKCRKYKRTDQETSGTNKQL